MAAQGIDIDHSTLPGWARQASRLLDAISTRIREKGLKAAKLHKDDTPLGNVTHADAYFGRADAIITQRERVKR